MERVKSYTDCERVYIESHRVRVDLLLSEASLDMHANNC